jgi:hypothetical protein
MTGVFPVELWLHEIIPCLGLIDLCLCSVFTQAADSAARVLISAAAAAPRDRRLVTILRDRYYKRTRGTRKLLRRELFERVTRAETTPGWLEWLVDAKWPTAFLVTHVPGPTTTTHWEHATYIVDRVCLLPLYHWTRRDWVDAIWQWLNNHTTLGRDHAFERVLTFAGRFEELRWLVSQREKSLV